MKKDLTRIPKIKPAGPLQISRKLKIPLKPQKKNIEKNKNRRA